MDNTHMYFSAAEIDYRRQRAARSIKARRRRGSRSPWWSRHVSDDSVGT